MSEEQTFVDLCLDGSAFLEDVDDFIDRWHESDDDRPVSAYLGMEADEYLIWVEHPSALRSIIAAHRANRPLRDYLVADDRELIAARADNPDEAERLVTWLEETGRLG